MCALCTLTCTVISRANELHPSRSKSPRANVTNTLLWLTDYETCLKDDATVNECIEKHLQTKHDYNVSLTPVSDDVMSCKDDFRRRDWENLPVQWRLMTWRCSVSMSSQQMVLCCWWRLVYAYKSLPDFKFTCWLRSSREINCSNSFSQYHPVWKHTHASSETVGQREKEPICPPDCPHAPRGVLVQETNGCLGNFTTMKMCRRLLLTYDCIHTPVPMSTSALIQVPNLRPQNTSWQTSGLLPKM
jgi:hypothetical protein